MEELVVAAGSSAHEHASIGAKTTYRVGGDARILLEISSLDELNRLAPLMAACELDVICLGNGSNLLFNDGEHDVIMVQLSKDLATLAWYDDGERVIVDAGAGHDLPIAARRLASDGVVGFEWAVGVPGTIGGAVVMNAGGHGADVAASLDSAVIWREGTASTWTKERLALGYRESAVERGDIVLSARFVLGRGDAHLAEERIREVVRWRREHQPGGQNGGSVFRNPSEDAAARLIEAAGCKGLRLGSAQVSEKHANFIQADPGGRARDVYLLINTVKQRVQETAGVTLVCENRLIGFEDAP